MGGGNLRNVFLAPLQIPLHLLRILHAGLHAGAGLGEAGLGFCAELFDFALFVVELAGSVVVSETSHPKRWQCSPCLPVHFWHQQELKEEMTAVTCEE